MASLATTAAFLGGLALVAYGAAAVYLPAGLIVGGVLLAVGAALLERGSPDAAKGAE